jgi:hypothetical protein
MVLFVAPLQAALQLKRARVSASTACTVGRNGDEFALASLDRLK